MWTLVSHLVSTLIACHYRKTLSMGVSLSGWGRILEEYPTQDTCLEISSVFIALKYFLPQLRGYHVLVCFNTMMVVSHFNYQGGLNLYALYSLARKILLWAETSFLGLKVIFILGCINQEADILLMQGVRQGEWHPHAYGKSLAQAVHCPVGTMLKFMLSEGLSPSTLKVYVAAIAVNHIPIHGASL